MKKLNEILLRQGDIILATGDGIVSKSVRRGTKSRISHAMLYVDGFSVIDSTLDGVHARNTQRLIFKDHHQVHALRLKGGLGPADARAIVRYARERIGTEYSVREAVRTRTGGGKRWSRREFCSRLVGSAYDSVGHRLVGNPRFCTPEELRLSDLLEDLGPVTVPVTAEEIAFWESRPDIPKLMRDSTNFILKGARKLDRSIQSLNDVDRHVMEHPESDAAIARLFRRSGYLTLRLVERAKNPWQYDLALMSQFPAADPGIAHYCSELVREAAAGPTRFEVNREGYAQYHAAYPRETFLQQLALNTQLEDDFQTRLSVAEQWLKAAGIEVPAAPPLRPHSAEWFERLDVHNPRLSAAARMIIGMSGTSEVCSICGDNPADDLLVTAGAEDLAPTIRLCPDCREIRTAAGEAFAPLPAE
jgi:hypothetical protein